MAGREVVTAEVGGRRLRLSNLDKVLYPGVGFTKAEVIDYYARIAPVLLPHLADRPVTIRRYPDGVDGPSFFEKDVARNAPEWMRTARLPTPGSSKGAESANFVLIDDVAGLVWLANLAALELHIPQWTVKSDGVADSPDLLVFDLDPGDPADLVQCCRVAERLRDVLADDDLRAWPKTSGSKGLQLYVPVRTSGREQTREYARELADRLSRETPDLVVSTMAKAKRVGRVLIDWSQNNPAKTTVAPYSLRARPEPTVAAPVTWSEVESCQRRADLVFTAGDVLDRVDRRGDQLSGLLTPDRFALPRQSARA